MELIKWKETHVWVYLNTFVTELIALNWINKPRWEREKLFCQIKTHEINAEGKYIIREEKMENG